MKLAETYKDWKDGSGKALVATEGGKGAPWRIYDGKTMPLLTAFLRTKHLANREQVYDGTAPTIAGGDGITWQAEKNVGTYYAYSEQYDITGGKYTVKPKELTLGFTSGTRFDKTYDGNANVTQSLTKGTNYSLTGFIGTEGAGIALNSVTGTYADKNAGTGKAVTFTGLTLTGAGAGNYSLSTTTLTATGNIVKRALTLEGTAGTQFTKTYDGTATVTQNLARGTNYRLAGVVEGEGTNIVALNESAAQGTYATANAQAAGAQQNVTFTNLALTGSGAGNYTLAARKTFENAGRITPKQLNLALTSGARFDKTYDGNANVAQSLTKDGNYTLTNFVNGEGADIALAPVTGKYAEKNAGTGKAVTFGGLTLTGSGAGNYVLNRTSLTGTGTIVHRDLTLTADAKSIVQDGPLPVFTGQASGFAEGEDVSVFGADGITFGTTVTNTDRPSRYDIIGRVGGVSDGVVGNYRIRQATNNATAFTVNAVPTANGILAALVQDAAPRFDFGFEDSVYLFGTPRPIRAMTLGFYRFDAERDLETQGLKL